MRSISVAPNQCLKDPGFFLLLAIFMIAAISVNGQQAIPSRSKNVILSAENLRFDFLLHQVTQQTGIKFSLNTQKFRPSRIIHVRKGIQSVGEILSEIKNSTGIYYTFLGDHIIFIDKRPLNSVVIVKKRTDIDPPSSLVPSKSIPHVVSIEYRKRYLPPLSIDSNTIYQSTSARIYSVQMDKKYLVQADTNLIARTNPSPDTSRRTRSTSRIPSNSRTPSTSRRTRSASQSMSFRPGFFTEAGLNADENFYFNPSLQAGWPFLYGIAQWSMNFNVSGFRYGVGGSLRLTDKWRLGLAATTGAYSKDYQENLVQGFPDITVTVKTDLQKLGMLAEMRITHKIQMQFGPVLNRLLTKYYNPLGVLTPLFINESDANSHYQYIKPPYTIQDNYSQVSAQNTRIWVGLQASLFYKINFPGNR